MYGFIDYPYYILGSRKKKKLILYPGRLGSSNLKWKGLKIGCRKIININKLGVKSRYIVELSFIHLCTRVFLVN